MANAWLIPCNAFRFQPSLHSQWLEKAAELICELMHMSAKHSCSAQSCGCYALWPRRPGDIKGAAPSSKWFGLAWGKPTSGLPGFRAGMVCTPRLCVSISAVILPGLNHGCYYIKACGGAQCGPQHYINLSPQRIPLFPTIELCTCAPSPAQAAASLLMQQSIHPFSSWPPLLPQFWQQCLKLDM